MSETPRDTIETQDWSNRELMLRIYYQVCEMNGSVRRLNGDMYGDIVHGLQGVKQKTEDTCDYLSRMKVVGRIAVAIAGTIATLLTALVVVLAEHAL